MPHFQKLPEHVRHLPDVVDTRLSRTEDSIRDLAARVTKLEHDGHAQPHHSVITQDIKTPVGTYPAYIILGLLVLAALRPDLIGQYLSR